MGPFQLSRWGTHGSGCSRHRCLSRQCCPLIKKMVVVLTMMIICLEQEYLDDNNVDVFSVLSQSVQLCHLLMMFIQDVKMWHPGIVFVFLSLTAVGVVVTAVTVFVIVAVAAFVTDLAKLWLKKII